MLPVRAAPPRPSSGPRAPDTRSAGPLLRPRIHGAPPPQQSLSFAPDELTPDLPAHAAAQDLSFGTSSSPAPRAPLTPTTTTTAPPRAPDAPEAHASWDMSPGPDSSAPAHHEQRGPGHDLEAALRVCLGERDLLEDLLSDILRACARRDGLEL